jgi:integrase
MDNITYDVRIWKTEIYKGTRVSTYKVRWKTGPRPWKRPFRTKAQAASFEAELRSAARRGEAFDITTGCPVSWGREDSGMSWYDFCVSYVDMKWKGSSGHHRANIAWTLVTVLPSMLASDRGSPDEMAMRTALRQWGFNTKQRGNCPDDAAAILSWVSRNTKPVAALADPAAARAVLDAAGTLLDGRAAAPSTVRRNRTILHNALEYAVELGLLHRNPIKAIKWKAPKTTHEVDRRCVVNHTQARWLLTAVREQLPSGPRLVAFFAVIYYTALRPEEAVGLRQDNITLPPLVRNDTTGRWEEPPDDWGELRFCSAATEIGAEWTDDGTRREHRQLKARAQGEWRRVPVPPPLTRILRLHLNQFCTGPGGRIFSGIRRGELASITYRRGWDKARRTVLTPADYASPLARRVYDLRHACVSTWLNGGVPPAQVAEWAGHSVAVLLKTYAKCIDGQDQMAKRRIEEALREPHDGHPGDTGPEGLNVAQVQAGEELRKALAQFDRETILGIVRELLAEGSADDDHGAS